jgi:hypothetical protein
MKRGGIQIKHQNGTAVQEVKYQYWTVTAVLTTSWHMKVVQLSILIRMKNS